ncbi:GDP-fucose transporter nac [Halictus rubicundus]|uniref:GDP-fucose transporter nac n=1 Tax=Halictus rubicundus TaxID=77578 RepID=UPI004035D21D
MTEVEIGLWSKFVYIAIVVASYWVVSILTVFINKALLSSDTINLDAPLFVTWCQCIISLIICVILSSLSKWFPKYVQFPNGNPYCRESFRKVLPLSLLFTGMIATNNLCLKHVGVAFYYIGRSLTTVFNVIFTYLILGQKTSTNCIACCGFIVLGFWLGVGQEHVAGSLSALGTIFGVLGSLTLSVYSIHMKQVLPKLNQEIWLLSYYNNAYSVIIFLPLMIANGEHITVYNYNKLGSLTFWSVMMVGGICGFANGYVSALQIKVTSPLTHNISGTAKACAQTVLATYWYNENKTLMWWFSNMIVLGGSAMYARLRQLDLTREYREERQLLKI